MKVIDASVALKWILPEEGSLKALKLIEDHASGEVSLVVPDLLFYEITNGLAVAVKLPPSQVEQILDWFYDLDLKIATLGRNDFKKAASIAHEFHISVYDASYVALAISLNTVFVTADMSLVKRLPEKLIKIDLVG